MRARPVLVEQSHDVSDRGLIPVEEGVETTLEVHGPAPDVPADVQLAVYRLVQEAVTNTLKHGGTGPAPRCACPTFRANCGKTSTMTVRAPRPTRRPAWVAA